jgi:FolB domain-containing protein
MDRSLSDLLTRIIGINDWERKRARDILINITLFTDIYLPRNNSIVDCRLQQMSKRIQAHAESAERLTVEALANDLVKICFEDKGVQKVILRVEKPGAVRFAKSVGVEIERNRGE